jgi:hypothetical protein
MSGSCWLPPTIFQGDIVMNNNNNIDSIYYIYISELKKICDDKEMFKIDKLKKIFRIEYYNK